MRSAIKILVSLILITVLPVLLQADSELPLHQKWLSEKVLIVWTGDHMQTIATVALATEKGIVVIETSLIRAHDARIRQVIEKEFGRNDFKYLINTHYHHDHTCGNQIYSDATIVPEEGLVAIGDVAPDQMLPYIRKDLKSDFSMTLENWGRIVNSPSEIKYVNMAHSDMFLSVETFKEQYRYLRTLWDELSEMYRQGQTIEDAKKKYTIENDFPYFKDRIVQTRRGNIHENNIEAIWAQISK